MIHKITIPTIIIGLFHDYVIFSSQV